MSVKDYVDLEGRIKLLQQMKTERLGYTVSLNRINALIKLCDSKFNKETKEIAKLFNITESNVHSLINETNKFEYTKLRLRTKSIVRIPLMAMILFQYIKDQRMDKSFGTRH